MKWSTTYTAYLAGPDLALVVEQDTLTLRWRFSVESDGALLYRGTAERPTPEGAQAAAEEWLANPPQAPRWPFDESIEQALDVSSWEEVPPPGPKGPEPA